MSRLTEQQIKAVEYVESPLLIVAGPGTGKTKVLTEKVIYLVEEKGYDPNRLLVSTFTIKAADELKERLRKKLGDKVESMQISTVHSFCQKMLQTFPEYHNFGNVFRVLDELDQFLFVNKSFWNWGLSEYAKDIDVVDLINFYNRCTENDVDPEKLSKLYTGKGDIRDTIIARSYNIYLGNLLNPNDTKLDFALLQREFFHLLQNNPEVLEALRKMFDYILIDEYQDTNPIQDAIFKLISEPHYNITVVGDEDQSIYGFRGASIKNFRTFLERYPEAKKLELEENFRSCKEIVECFDIFMKPNRTFDKKIFTNNPAFSSPLLVKGDTSVNEGKEIVKLIQNLTTKHNVAHADIAILFKSVRFHAEDIINELDNAKIPFVTIGDSSLLTQDEIKDMLILMLYVNSYTPNKYQQQWLFDHDILSSEILNLDKDSVEKLASQIDIYDLLGSIDLHKLKQMEIVEKDIDTLINLKNLQKQFTRNPINQLRQFYRVLDATGYHVRLFRKYLDEKDGNADIAIRNLAKFSKLLMKFEENTYSKEYKTLLYHLNTIPESKMDDAASNEEINAVKLMTIHQAKGLEFPVVILGGVTNRRYNKNSQEDSFILDIPPELMLDKHQFNRGEELQRTFYVGMSRAEKILCISTIEGKGNKPSQYLDSIGSTVSPDSLSGELKEDEHYKPPKEKIKLSYSSVSAYIDCPFRFFCRDYLGFQTPTDYYQVYGVIVHNALKKLHVLIKEGKQIEIQDIIEIVDLYCKDDSSRKKWRDELITDLWTYYEKTSGFIKEVVDVELPFSYINSDVVVNGQVDLVIRNKDDELEIIDYKSRYKDGLAKMNVDMQLRIYSMALANRYPEEIKKLSAYTFKDNHQTPFSNSPEDIEKTKETVSTISSSIEDKKFRRNWGGSFCDTKTGKCEFYYICKNLEGDD